MAQNVAAGVEYDKDKVKKCLEEAGMWENVEKMEKGMDTIIFKQEDEGVEISGGEAQKIAIARALYKEAPVVILDEPTAALDPVSELEIYERFDEMVDEKTAIYISHRMSSCRFLIKSYLWHISLQNLHNLTLIHISTQHIPIRIK